MPHLEVLCHTPERGPAPLAFLYLHGLTSDQEGEKAAFFRAAARRAGFAFCSLDFQGHGRSGGTMRGMTLSRNLADARRAHGALRQRGYREVVVLGSSMGGLTGLWYAALYPEEVLAGLYIAPALAMAEGFRAFAGEEGVERWRREGVLRVETEQARFELGWPFIEDLEAHPVDELVRRHRRPALLLQGKRDESVPWRTVVDFATRCECEEVELHLFADGDHRLADRKDRLWELMLEFLRGRGLLS